MRARIVFSLLFIGIALPSLAQSATPLPQTLFLTNSGDLSAQMVEGIDRWLMRETQRVSTNRADLAKVNDNYKQQMRSELRAMIGVVDERIPNPRLQFLGDERGTEVFRTTAARGFAAYRVRWPVFEGVFGEGLLLEPLEANKAVTPIASIIAIPDADQLPEAIAGLRADIPPESQFARRLAESGCRVLVPVLVSRDDEFSAKLTKWAGTSSATKFRK